MRGPCEGAQRLKKLFLIFFSFFCIQAHASNLKVISLAPDLTEMMYALSLENYLVGVSDFSDYPAQAKKKPSVGSFISPNIERILMLNPSLVLTREGATPPQLILALQQKKIPLFSSKALNEEDIYQTLSYLGQTMNRHKKAQKLLLQMKNQFATLSKRLHGLSKPSVIIQIETHPALIAGKDTLLDRAIELAGGINAARSFSHYPKLQTEYILKLNPNYIVFAKPKNFSPMNDWKTSWTPWPHMDAVQKNHLVTLDADLISRASIRFCEGVQLLAKIIHPELTDL